MKRVTENGKREARDPHFTFHVSRFTLRGFTLIELMIVIGIIAILSSVAFFNLVGYEARRDLELTTQRIAALFRDGRSRSVTQEVGSAWGILIHNSVSPAQFQLLRRDASACGFVAGSQAGVVNLSSRFALLSVVDSASPVPNQYPSASNPRNICFEPLTGFLKTAALSEPVIITIDLLSGGGTPSTVKIYNNGRIE